MVLSGKSDEVAALLQMTQIIANGRQGDTVNFICNHECSKIPPSLFLEDGTMGAGGTKANLLKCLKDETKIQGSTTLPQTELRTVVLLMKCMLYIDDLFTRMKHL